MLIILIGGTLDVGEKSRQYFESRGYSVIQKYNYVTEATPTSHLGKRHKHTEEEVMRCDLVYDIHGGKTGFNKSQILDAVRGRTNAMMTTSPDTMDFVQQVLDTYGDYVIPVYLYIDEESLKAVTARFVSDPEDFEKRIKKGQALRRMYLENMGIFKKVVLFSKEEPFSFEGLFAQYDQVIKEAQEAQKRLNGSFYVDLPYKGDQDYIFVSYSHKDSLRVMPYLSALQRKGYRVWYDEGIHKGANWQIFLGERLQGCTNFLLFSSESAVESEFVMNELNGLMLANNTHPITVQLDDADFPLGIKMYLSKYQYIKAWEDDVVESLSEVLSPTTKARTMQG